MVKLITERDRKLISYLENGMIITTKIASELVYYTGNKASSFKIAQNRLTKLYKAKEINRKRDNVTNSFIYYVGKAPSKVNHRLKIAEFIGRLNTIGFEVVLVDLEFSDLQKKYGFRPDALIVVSYHKRIAMFLLEVDITKSFSNVEKYNKLLIDRKNKVPTGLPDYPLVVVSVCNKPIDKNKCYFKPVKIKIDLSDIENIKYPFIK